MMIFGLSSNLVCEYGTCCNWSSGRLVLCRMGETLVYGLCKCWCKAKVGGWVVSLRRICVSVAGVWYSGVIGYGLRLVGFFVAELVAGSLL